MDIKKDDITQSVRYYNKVKKIGTKNTLERYLAGIKSFYKYLVDNKQFKEIFFENHITSIKEYVDEICKDKEIDFSPITKRSPLPEETIIELLDKLDSYDYNGLLMNSSEKQKLWYNKYKTLRIFIKLTLIAPAKKNIITKLTLDNIDLHKRQLKINNIYIDIPNGLFRDLNEYLIIREDFNKINDINDNFLFMHSNNTDKIADNELNKWFGEFLFENRIIDITPKKSKINKGKNEYEYYSCPIEPIMNSALYALVLNGTDLTLISKISGVKEEAIIDKFCKDKNANEFTHKLINNEISKNYYYKYI